MMSQFHEASRFYGRENLLAMASNISEGKISNSFLFFQRLQEYLVSQFSGMSWIRNTLTHVQ